MGSQQCPSAMGPCGIQPCCWHRAPAPQPVLPHAQLAMLHPTNPAAPSVTLHPVSPTALCSHRPTVSQPCGPRHQLLQPIPYLCPSPPQPSEVPSPLCSQQCWRGTAPQSPHGCPGPRGSSVPPYSAWHVDPASWHVPRPWGDTPGAGVLAAGSPRIGDRLIKCVILNYPDKSIRAFKVNSLNIIMKRAFLCSR